MSVENTKKWMTFWGWSNGGAPGAIKTDGGYVVARYGDKAWVEDVEEACRKVEYEQIVNEIERRERQHPGIK